MTQRRKRRKYKKSGKTSSALGDTPVKEGKEVYKQLGLTVLSFAAGQIVGAAAGKFSGYAGALITGAGFWKKNIYATSFGAGMTLSESNGAAGFSIESIKERSMGYVKTVGEKFLSPLGTAESAAVNTATTTNGLGEGEAPPKYFLNPYTENTDFNKALRDLDHIENKVREVSGIENEEVGDLSEENY